MRKITFGILVAVVVLCASSLVSYVILDHFYGKGYVTTSTRTIIIENSGQQVTIANITFDVESAAYMPNENEYVLNTSAPASVSVPSGAYEQAQESGNPVTVSNITRTETKPLNTIPIAASVGIVMSIVVFGVWVGYRRMWGDATSTLLEHGLHDMTVRDVEIVGQIMELKEFTIPQLMKETRASKITAWRTVQKLVEEGLVQQTKQTNLAANGAGGRGKPSRVYKYVGKPEKE